MVRPPDSSRTIAISSRDSDACVCTSALLLGRQAGDGFEQFARARHGEARRERGAQPSVGGAVPALAERQALVDRRARRLLQARRHLARRSIMHLPIVARMPLSATASNTASVSCTVSIVSTAVVPLASSSVVASRAAARSVAGVCAASIGQTRVAQPVHQRQIVGVAAEERLAEMDVGLDEAREDVAAARVDRRGRAVSAMVGADRRDPAVADRHVALDDRRSVVHRDDRCRRG